MAFSALLVTQLSACASSTSNDDMVIGDISATQLLADNLLFDASYRHFQLTDEQIAQIKALSNDVSVDIYFGTWCHDSQREVPRLLKALSHNPQISTKLVALDYQKVEPAGRAKAAGVKYTPTMIVKVNGKEVGRIIERPKVDLITDLVSFVQ